MSDLPTIEPRVSRLRLASVEPFVYRVPLATPVQTSFGIMHDRPAVLLRVVDEDGTEGWGEAWCNFPAVGAEHRARLVRSVLAPIATAGAWEDPAALFRALTERTAVLAIQCGEPGPIAQAIAGLDIAAWDLVARRAGLPLWRLLGGASDRIRVYASGLNPDSPEKLAAERKAQGYTAFKLKVGFGEARDLRNLAELRAAIGPQSVLMVDANQAWSRDEAVRIAPRLERFELAWLEEPLRADQPWYEWQSLQAASAIPLAAGENVAGDAGFEQAILSGVLSVVQPDLAKWGGFSGCLPVARRVLAAGLRFCPHYLGGGIGLLASGHLLAAVGGDGLLEIDANPNPLRTALWGPLGAVHDGECALGAEPGLGRAPDLAGIARYRVAGDQIAS